MKGTIVKCLEGLAKLKGGEPAWKEILKKAGVPEHAIFTTTTVVPDGDVLKMVGAAAEVLKDSVQQAMDAFGDHWSTSYAPGIYSV